MNRRLLILALFLPVLLAADSKPWPKKGDVLFVSYPGLEYPLDTEQFLHIALDNAYCPTSENFCSFRFTRCQGVSVVKVNQDKGFVMIGAPGIGFIFRGQWWNVLTPSYAECQRESGRERYVPSELSKPDGFFVVHYPGWTIGGEESKASQ